MKSWDWVHTSRPQSLALRCSRRTWYPPLSFLSLCSHLIVTLVYRTMVRLGTISALSVAALSVMTSKRVLHYLSFHSFLPHPSPPSLVAGQVLCKPGSITPHKKFEAQMYVLSKVRLLHQRICADAAQPHADWSIQEEGGRHTPFVNGYRPQLFIRTGNITCTIGLPEGKVWLIMSTCSTPASPLDPLDGDARGGCQLHCGSPEGSRSRGSLCGVCISYCFLQVP